MQTCQKCNIEAPDGIEICSNCGNSLIPAQPVKAKINWLKWIIMLAIIGYVVWNQDDSESNNDNRVCCEYKLFPLEMKQSRITSKQECLDLNGKISYKTAECNLRNNYKEFE